MPKSYHEMKGYKSRGYGIFHRKEEAKAPPPRDLPLCEAPYCCEDGRFGVDNHYFCRHHQERARVYIEGQKEDAA